MCQLPIDRNGGFQPGRRIFRFAFISGGWGPGKFDKPFFISIFDAKTDIARILVIEHLEHFPVSFQKRKIMGSLQLVRDLVCLLDIKIGQVPLRDKVLHAVKPGQDIPGLFQHFGHIQFTKRDRPGDGSQRIAADIECQ